MIRLSIIDFRSHRLPNVQVAAMIGSVALSMTLTATLCETWSNWRLAWMIAICNVVVYFVLWLMSRGQLGMGDVKYAFPLGLLVGWSNPSVWLDAIWWTFILGGAIAGLNLCVMRFRSQRRKHNQVLPLGPYMSIASFIAATLPIWH